MNSIVSSESIAAAKRLPGVMTLCSAERGWNSLLLRRFDEPREADFETRATKDQLIVLVKGGFSTVESWAARGWKSAQYRIGDLGMIPPGEANRLRFYGPTSHQTLQLHIPSTLLMRAEEAVGRPLPYLAELQTRHSLVAAIISKLEQGLEAGAPEIYAESAVHFLLMQMLWDAGYLQKEQRGRSSKLGARLDAYMRAHLAAPITLTDMAAEIDLSVFQLIRLCRSLWGTTPAARLTLLRLEWSKKLLETSDQPMTVIASDCGYENPSHFATAFRRHFGLSPTKYRELCDR